MRIRSIKPQIVEDEKVAPMGDIAFRLFVCMIALADDHGNVKADARWLRSQIWWAHENAPSIPAVATALGELAPLIETYEASGTTFAHLRGWAKHQRISNAGRPLVPLHPSAASADLIDNAVDESASRGESRRTSANRGSDKEKEKEKEKEKSAHPISLDWIPDSEGIRRSAELDLDVEREARDFRNHYLSIGNRRKDWNPLFLKWLDRSRDFAAGTRPGASVIRDLPDLNDPHSKAG